MKKYCELDLGFADAANYRTRQNKDLFHRFFVLNENLEKLLKPNIYFLIGGKGTGKTAFSTYLSNTEYKNTSAKTIFISETEYEKFVSLRTSKNLMLSDYTSIWKVLLLLLISNQVKERENAINSLKNYTQYQRLRDGIDEFYGYAFAPEIITAFNVVERSNEAIEILSKHLTLSSANEKQHSYDGKVFQNNLLYLERVFKGGIEKLKLSKNHILFIDGIDIRPKNIPYQEYLDCVKGLAHAVWLLNNDFFGGIRDSKGRIKVVLLLRPDIFAELGLQNANNKIRDNSVLLEWKTIYPQYRSSYIFGLADRMLSVQQEPKEKHEVGDCWDYYFPFKTASEYGSDDSFVSFLRYSLFRPRDIITLMQIIKDSMIESGNALFPYVKINPFSEASIKSKYSDYLLGEIRDYLLFYHSENDYNLFLKFFEYLNGKARFSYDEYIDAYEEFGKFIEASDKDVPSYMQSSSDFLQFLYDMDVICYYTENIDGTNQMHWSFRERNYSNLNPKVQEGSNYLIHYGLQKAFDTGKPYIRRAVIKKRTIVKQ